MPYLISEEERNNFETTLNHSYKVNFHMAYYFHGADFPVQMYDHMH